MSKLALNVPRLAADVPKLAEELPTTPNPFYGTFLLFMVIQGIPQTYVELERCKSVWKLMSVLREKGSLADARIHNLQAIKDKTAEKLQDRMQRILID
ncbi:hypothetical protein [Vibrio owensii]|uniref:hypothetical protein n=1 Tax=Vibrio owensii TaxID=696485 RepID=UPI0005851F89|nr:hypothetical protein [Vibrio owensii]